MSADLVSDALIQLTSVNFGVIMKTKLSYYVEKRHKNGYVGVVMIRVAVVDDDSACRLQVKGFIEKFEQELSGGGRK